MHDCRKAGLQSRTLAGFPLCENVTEVPDLPCMVHSTPLAPGARTYPKGFVFGSNYFGGPSSPSTCHLAAAGLHSTRCFQTVVYGGSPGYVLYPTVQLFLCFVVFCGGRGVAPACAACPRPTYGGTRARCCGRPTAGLQQGETQRQETPLGLRGALS